MKISKKSRKYKKLMKIRSKNSLRKFGYDYKKWGLITTIYGNMNLKDFIELGLILTGKA